MLAVELQHAAGAHLAHLLARPAAEVFFHLQRDRALGGHRAGQIGELGGEFHLAEALAQRLLDEVEEFPVFDVALLGGFFLLVGLKAEIVGDDVAEALAVLVVQRLEHHLVERGEQIDQLIAAAAHLFALGKAHRVLE